MNFTNAGVNWVAVSVVLIVMFCLIKLPFRVISILPWMAIENPDFRGVRDNQYWWPIRYYYQMKLFWQVESLHFSSIYCQNCQISMNIIEILVHTYKLNNWLRRNKHARVSWKILSFPERSHLTFWHYNIIIYNWLLKNYQFSRCYYTCYLLLWLFFSN